MKMEQIMVSPALAAEFLKANVGNRQVKKTGVDRWASAMERGEWVETPEGISFSAKGILLDGQNRLHAVIKSGCTVPMTVFRDVQDNAFPVMNVGVTRSSADSTKLPRAHAEVLSFIFMTASISTMKPTGVQLLEMDKFVGPHISSLMEYCNSSVKTTSRASVRAAAVAQSMLGHRTEAFDLYRRLVLGDVQGLPSIATIFIKQQLSSTLIAGVTSGGGIQMVMFTKAMQVLSPSCKDKKRLLYSDDLRAEAVSALRHAVDLAKATA